MTLSDLCLRRPVLAIVMNVLVLVGGAAALLTLPVRELPDIDTAQITVTVAYEGAAPEVVDAQITTIVEGAISGVSGIRSVSSEAERGQSRTVIEFDTSRDIDDAANDVRSEMARVSQDLPEEADEPLIEKNDSESDPVIRLSMTSDRLSAADLTDYADRYIVDQLATIEGVASVEINGERAYAMRVWLDRRALSARGVTVSDVTTALENNNVELPAGEIETADRQFQVRTTTRFREPAEFERLIVRQTEAYPIRLGDVAQVEVGVEDDDTIFRANGVTSVGLGVIRQSQSNTVQISDAVQAEVARLAETLPEGTRIAVSSDDAVFIRSSIHEVVVTLVIAIALVVAVNFLFLASLRATIVPAVTIPISLIGACAGLALLGFSINILTLFALILAIGLVVDDAIVVLENIQRRIDEGESRLAASSLGASQVTFAVLATSGTLIAVFVPLSFLQGQVGRLFSEFGLVLGVAVAISTFVSLSLCPMLCAFVLQEPGAGKSRFERFVERRLEGLNRLYRAALSRALRFPAFVLAIAVFIAASSVALYERLPNELTPPEDRGQFFVRIEAPLGSSLAYTDKATGEVEAILQPLREAGLVTNVLSIVGQYNELRRAFVIVRLSDWAEREESTQALIERLRPQIARITGAQARLGAPAGLGLRGSNNPLQISVGGPQFDEVNASAETLAEAMRANEGLTGIEVVADNNQPGYEISVNRDRARDLGVEVRDVSEALQTLFASNDVTEYEDRGRQYPVIVQARTDDRNSARDLSNVFLRNAEGGLVALDGLVDVAETATPRALNRYDRLPSVEVSAGLAEGYDLGRAIDFVNAAAAEKLPAGTQIAYKGQAREFLDTSGGILVVFGIALLIVFLVLAGQFESFVHPIIILLTVPLGIAGALATILFTGQSLNIYSQVGLILLVGLMAKNGILIVEFANQLRDEGRSVREAILEGSVVRLRPILMTTVATVLGAVPLMLTGGAGSESRAAIGAVIVGGFTVATVLTLFVTPVIYDLLARFTSPRSAVAGELDAALDKAAAGHEPEAAPAPAE
ncbi:efflux RND transporter permease subunit [Aurantimonas sp. Leaf443]|uniref:efflux RND transporter permease subunit n=1 Tax=Aurantimonas sp. Leaf443 TaxID=1736378 RepID=UPI0006F64DA8|nr:efflux RND transporter permease subunit [Aurantimonas sp. Leaf443]KQT88174.1 multidrug transporter AcrB [Aurantimonas sp. Leaf443]